MFPRFPPRDKYLDHYPNWFTTCCGFNISSDEDKLNRRNLYLQHQHQQAARNYFYSPSTIHLDCPAAGQIGAGSSWAVSNFGPVTTAAGPNLGSQPYFLLSQPVIIQTTANPLQQQHQQQQQQHQHQQVAQQTYATAMPIFTTRATTTAINQQQNNSILQSHYAIYGSNMMISNPTAPTAIQQPTQQHQIEQNKMIHDHRPHLHQMPTMTSLMPVNVMAAEEPSYAAPSPSANRQEAAKSKQIDLLINSNKQELNSEIFRRLEAIEKQYDLSIDMDLIERHGIVITRAIDPIKLMPYLTEATLRKYQENFITTEHNPGASSNQEEYVIRFIEIIKRPGQTLGLFIRTILFESTDENNKSIANGISESSLINRQLNYSRAGVIITKIDSDSPIYNSQVLHVGDEIISINLIDIQNMSLDDVVVLMSIPKRLVLALRIPKDRDQILSLNLMQQQALERNAQHLMANRFPLMNRPTQLNGGSWMHPNPNPNPNPNLNSNLNHHQFVLNNNNNQQQQQQQFINRFRQPEVMPTQNMQQLEQQQVDQDFNSSIQASLINEMTQDDDEIRRELSLWRLNSIQQATNNNNNNNNNNNSSSSSNNFIQRPIRVQSATGHLDNINGPNNNNNNNNTNSSDLNLEDLTDDLEMSSSLKQAGAVNQKPNMVGGQSWTSGHRTLPARPTSVALGDTQRQVNDLPEKLSSSSKQIIGNLRLADTPEQSSYFSSSIDAINRELKELRRQRMALSNSETSSNPTNFTTQIDS